MTAVPYTSIPLDPNAVTYAYGPDSAPRPGVSPGHIERFTIEASRTFPGTTRTVWVHTAAVHDSSAPSSAMFFNDGWWYLDPDAAVRGAVVLDNLAAQEAIPPLVSVFVDPGIRTASERPKNRNIEYDAFDSRYADFLLDEVLPLVAELHAISPLASDRGICGGSSGGNAAFTAAWQRPDAIGRVIAFNSSFAQMPGGNPYPALLHGGARRDLRVLLHAAHRDIGWNDPEDNWFAETLETSAALTRTGHDVRLVVGDGGHSPEHGGVLLPDALRWLWR
ncbi:alpha/beta hydrolase-fold protein [Microbacterium sp. H1-D42]|uniref:alpha/beta hydrolase n=1 Tax=Microbacterium sp. H1-D42 TaxID=2925844 RepID=UPI001F53D224|nr:alpha/beta hydrolase-fold protein [Microbacterium sp. H1-D42]UNK69919.1 alpha/beta hydrolase-fold protein [Microbacterium sp. H1-D42]